MTERLTHLDEQGAARMVDVGAKEVTARRAVARAVLIAIASGPVRTMAGRMKLHSGGTSTTFTSIARRSASSKTLMFTSVSLVAAIAMKVPSRSSAL